MILPHVSELHSILPYLRDRTRRAGPPAGDVLCVLTDAGKTLSRQNTSSVF
jgi:hypothetical protein